MSKVILVDLSQAELACRIAESMVGVKRPVGATANEALSAFDEETRVAIIGAAGVAFSYFSERVSAASGLSAKIVHGTAGHA